MSVPILSPILFCYNFITSLAFFYTTFLVTLVISFRASQHFTYERHNKRLMIINTVLIVVLMYFVS